MSSEAAGLASPSFSVSPASSFSSRGRGDGDTVGVADRLAGFGAVLGGGLSSSCRDDRISHTVLAVCMLACVCLHGCMLHVCVVHVCVVHVCVVHVCVVHVCVVHVCVVHVCVVHVCTRTFRSEAEGPLRGLGFGRGRGAVGGVL